MLAPKRWYASSMLCTTCTKFAVFLLSRKFCTTQKKSRHASTSSGFMEWMKFSSCINFWMSGSSKTAALSFSILSPENDWQMDLKHSPSLSGAFTNFLISPDFMCWEGGGVGGGGYYLVSGYKWFVYDFFVSSSECFLRVLILFNPIVGFIATVAHRYEARMFCIARLLSKQEIHHF